MASTSPTAAWANYYRRAGWRVFPVWPEKKNPMFSGWQKDATTDPDLIERYFREPENNVGVVCGEVFDAWDIEVEHVEAFAAWMVEHDYRLPEAPIASTGRGGIHILTAPTGVDGTRYLYLDGKHIGELKSRGGYILICPSVTEQMYRWTWLPERLAVQPAPEWLLALLERPKTARLLVSRVTSPADVSARLTGLGRAVANAAGLGRNNYLFWAMRRAIEEGVPGPLAGEALLDAYMAGIQPGEDPSERRHEGTTTIESALRAEAAN